jgi:nitrogen fixation NifU-like protein
MSLNYTPKTIKHFLKPKNIGLLKNPDAQAEIGNMVCGDQLSFTLKVKGGKIQDIKFLSFGCASNIATASIMTEKVKGMSLAAAKKFNWQAIVDELGGLPRQKIHCSMMAVEGLRKVIAMYEKEHPLTKKVFVGLKIKKNKR